jgi:glycosyltransferase involved in cell wall biosynthesis
VVEIERVLKNPALRQEYALRGRERATARFSLPTVAAEHLRFFEELT